MTSSFPVCLAIANGASNTAPPVENTSTSCKQIKMALDKYLSAGTDKFKGTFASQQTPRTTDNSYLPHIHSPSPSTTVHPTA